VFRNRAVPEVLLSGDHGRIAEFRQQMSERLTRERRPDLWEKFLINEGLK
jgi:tRNA (guanine37-N1)-methyltransferase